MDVAATRTDVLFALHIIIGESRAVSGIAPARAKTRGGALSCGTPLDLADTFPNKLSLESRNGPQKQIASGPVSGLAPVLVHSIKLYSIVH